MGQDELGIYSDQDDLKDTLARCYRSTVTTGLTLFPERFPAVMSSLHQQMVSAIDSPHRKVVIAAPRGLGKTSWAKTFISKKILFRETSFVVYVSNSATLAEMETEGIKMSLRTNQTVRKLFGDPKPASGADLGLDDTFSRSAWVAFGNILVLPRGAGQQVRGLNWSDHRPDIIVVDDLENKEELSNELIRKRIKEWFYGDLLMSVDAYSDNWKIIYIDTLKHEDSLLQDLLAASDWHSVNLSLFDDDMNSLAPSYMTTEQLRKERDEYAARGALDVFYRERGNLPISSEDAVFQGGYFRYYQEDDEEFIMRKPFIENVVLIDPAKSVKLHSAESAIVGVGFDGRANRIYVRDVVAGKFHPDRVYQEAIDMALRLKAVVIGIEVTSLNEFITYPFQNELVKRRVGIQLVELKARGKKEDRAAALVPLYRSGSVYHNPQCCSQLEAQELSFPRPKRWDVLDALAYIVPLLEEGGRYFTSLDTDGPKFDESEYAELEAEYEPALTGWRIV